MAETASSCGTRGRNSQRRRARRDSRARTADTTSVSTSVRRGPTLSDSAEWNTRQESNLRALGSKPNGDAGNPRLVYWIRRQESDLRGLRSERSWDASNPHLSKSGGPSRNRTLLTGFGDQSPPRGQPELAERSEPESHAASGTVCVPDSPRTLPGSRSKMAEGGRSRATHPRGCHSFSKRGCAPAHFTFQCWQRLSESNAHDPCGSSSVSSRLSTPHASL